MDRLNQIKGETGGSRDLTLDTSTPPSESFMTANESSSKYFSLSEVDSTFDVSPTKDSSVATTADPERTITDSELISNLSPIHKKVDTFKIGKQIEAANILSGGVNIFDDNDNSYDGNELVIDDNVLVDDEKHNNRSENLVLPIEKPVESRLESLNMSEVVHSKDTEVVLQIDGKNVDAIAIGNGLYLYRKTGVEELAAVQIIDDNKQQPSYKFLKVRENSEGNLEVYEEIEVQVPKEVPAKERKPAEKETHVPTKDISEIMNDTSTDKCIDDASKNDNCLSKTSSDLSLESHSEVNLNGKKVKYNESLKSPVINSFTPMKYHSTPNKEGIPLTKTMVNQQLDPNRQSDNIKKTIEVHTDGSKKESPIKNQNVAVIKEDELPETRIQKLEPNSEMCVLSPEAPNVTDKMNDPVKCSDIVDQKGMESKVSDDNKHYELILKPLEDSAEPFKRQSSLFCPFNDTADKEEKTENPPVTIDNIQRQCELKVLDDDKTSVKIEQSKILDDKIKMTENEMTQEKRLLVEDDKVLLKGDNNSVYNTNKDISIKCDSVFAQASVPTALKVEISKVDDTAHSYEMCSKKKFNNVADNMELTVEKDNNIIPTDIENPCGSSKCSNLKLMASKESSTFLTENVKNINNKDNNATNDHSMEIHKFWPNSKLKDEIAQNVVDNISKNLTSLNKNIVSIDQPNTPLIGEEKNTKIISDSSNNPLLQNNELKANYKDIESSDKNETCQLVITEPIKDLNETPKINEDSTEKEITIKLSMSAHGDQNINQVLNKPIVMHVKHELPLTDTSANTVHAQELNKNQLEKSQSAMVKIVTTQSEVVGAKTNIIIKHKSEISVEGKKCSGSILGSKSYSKEYEKVITPHNKEILHSQTKIVLPTTIAKTEISKLKMAENKSSSNHSAVPFGKWTEAHRQEFLNKIKETKIVCSNSNTKQIKQPNDLNRRDILKKIDTQRQAHQTTAKLNDFGISNKSNVKKESAIVFINKPNPLQKSQEEKKIDQTLYKTNKNVSVKKSIKDEGLNKEKNETVDYETSTPYNKKNPIQRKEIINNQDLIDKTIEGIINRAVSTKPHEEWKQTIKMDAVETLKSHNSIGSLDDIEKKMNELHGIPFVERPVHELPQVNVEKKSETSANKSNSIPSLIPFKNKTHYKEPVTENISDEEIIEHEPITGDMNMNPLKPPALSDDLLFSNNSQNNNETKMEAVITEKDFDKFARRNSVTYENCLTVNFDGKEKHNVIQTLVEKEVPCKKLTRNELMLAESKAKSTNKQLLLQKNNTNKISGPVKNINEEESFNKNYQSQSKVQLAYQSALTAKRQLECPITIIEDKLVKVANLEAASDFTSVNLNVQNQEPSSVKKSIIDSDSQSASESVDSDILDTPYAAKSHDEVKSKSKHQRKQVLTPVETAEIELIEPADLGILESPKKRRKIEEHKERTSKNIAPKKSYLLNRTITNEQPVYRDLSETPLKESPKETKTFVGHTDTISAIDNLVKAAELIETQSENKSNTLNVQTLNTPIVTPPKRGRGRPRKYPLSETSLPVVKTPTSHKKSTLSETKLPKFKVDSDDSDSIDEFIKENWTMGKINENIVCPICNKLFRSENVVFKHVKHCTGPSPNRSDSDRRSLRQLSRSERKSCDSDTDVSDIEEIDESKNTKPKESKVSTKQNDVIVIEDTPVQKSNEEIKQSSKNLTKIVPPPKSNNLICEFCGKTFRQLSYLVSHREQHKRGYRNKSENGTEHGLTENKSIFGCEVCKKEFRKLHHLVQHRKIHSTNTSSRLLRKNSNDKNEVNQMKEEKKNKKNEDQSAGFRCEPCDKSFRKLHHLVEHRETHDGINKRTSTTNIQPSGDAAKIKPQHVCGLCNKSFQKIQQLIEHKEQHLDSGSEKSDDKSVKSSLSTKDIIHECSLCYMVFPNEHSLNKHTIICLKKKKQALAKQAKVQEQKDGSEEILDSEDKISDDEMLNTSDKEEEVKTLHEEDIKETPEKVKKTEIMKSMLPSQNDTDEKLRQGELEENIKDTTDIIKISPLKRIFKEDEKVTSESDDNPSKNQSKIRKIEIITIPDTPTPKKKITSVKSKTTSTVIKRNKSISEASVSSKCNKPPADSSDDEEIRYMLNPNYNVEETLEGKLFMKVRANKRSSLQIERPNSKKLIKRRISLQNPTRSSRVKAKPIEYEFVNITNDKRLNEPEHSTQTDSDDSDVKYAFPETVAQNGSKERTRTSKRQSGIVKRKSVTAIAKRKSLIKHKIPVPTQPIKRRTNEVEHRCDCGQLFSSAALLARHATLAHTPPRVRRPRVPPPDKPTRAAPAPPRADERRKTVAGSSKTNTQVKKTSTPTTNNLNSIKNKKLKVGSNDSKATTSVTKSIKVEPNMKKLRSAAHKGVPVPDRMKKFMERAK